MNSNLINDLAANGCDVQSVLTDVFMGNEAFYMKIFGKLANGNNAIERLGAAIEANDAKAVFEASHELKGVYGNLGLTPLYKAVCEIVEPARAGSTEGVADKFPALKELHERIVALA